MISHPTRSGGTTAPTRTAAQHFDDWLNKFGLMKFKPDFLNDGCDSTFCFRGIEHYDPPAEGIVGFAQVAPTVYKRAEKEPAAQKKIESGLAALLQQERESISAAEEAKVQAKEAKAEAKEEAKAAKAAKAKADARAQAATNSAQYIADATTLAKQGDAFSTLLRKEQELEQQLTEHSEEVRRETVEVFLN